MNGAKLIHGLEKGKMIIMLTVLCAPHGGKNDIKKHTNTATHKASVHQSASKMQKKVSSYFTSDGSIEQEKVISAEVSFVFHSVKCSHSYVSVDCCSRLFLQLFPDSKISRKYSCGRRKATKMISSMLGLYSEEQTIWQLSDSVYYSVSLDASNKGHIKTFPLVVRHFSHEEGVCIKILSFYNSDSETYDSIVAGIKSKLNKACLPLKNISSFCADSASVNFGKNKSVFVELRKENPNLIAAACNCHLLNNAIKQAANTLQIDVEAIVIKIYNEFRRSTKRVMQLKEYLAWMDIEWQEILKHVPTQWLSLVLAVE